MAVPTSPDGRRPAFSCSRSHGRGRRTCALCARASRSPHDEGLWLSIGGAAAYLGTSPRTVYRLIDVGLLPGFRFGRPIRVRKADLDGLIETARIEPGTLAENDPPIDTEID